ncbi:MAG: TolC family protein [Cyclobacteriaceae bacterium]|nr:TolC family protein [Cyclobacteriaceae bacterium]
MKRLYLVLLALSLSIITFAQEQKTTSFTLGQCIEYALQNSVNMQNAIIDQEIAQSKVKETIGIGLPQINASVNATTNPTLPRFFSRKITSYNFIPADSRPPYADFLPQLGDNDVLAGQNFFQLPNSLNASASISQLIFNGSYLVGLQASSTFKDLAYKTTIQTKEQTIEQVTKAFYAALINRERLDLFENNIARVDSLLRSTTALNANGFAESIDVDRIQVSLNNLTTEKAKFERLQLLTVEVLKFQMNYPMNENIDVVGNISELPIDVQLNDYLVDWDLKQRPDYQVLEVNRKLQSLNVKNRYFAALPVLSANANLGYSKQGAVIGDLFKRGPSFEEINGTGPNKLYPFSSIGVTLSMPIFTGLQHSYQLQQEKLKLQKVENSFKSLKSGIDLQIKQAVTAYQNSVQSLDVQKKNMGLAEKVARITKIKYEQGVGSNLEVVDAESSLKESQINYYNALYDAVVAKTDLDKAFGKLVPQTQKEK